MHSMASAEAGQLLSHSSCLSALYGSMNPLHTDRMEHYVAALSTELSPYASEIMASTPNADVDAVAKLNTMLHLSIGSENGFYAGNIYTQSKLRTRIPTETTLLKDLIAANGPTMNQSIRSLAPLVKSVVVEINAMCDHAQQKIRTARFVAGVIVPRDQLGKIKKKAEFLYDLGPFFLDSRLVHAGIYYIYLSGRHLLTMELSQVKDAKPYARLRGQAFNDLQVWFAYRTSRPGMLMLRG